MSVQNSVAENSGGSFKNRPIHITAALEASAQLLAGASPSFFNPGNNPGNNLS